MNALRCLILVSNVLATCVSVLAGIRPSFMPEESSWRATDIVVVTEGKEIDGVVQVIETWKGELKPGSTLTIPELAEFKAKRCAIGG